MRKGDRLSQAANFDAQLHKQDGFALSCGLIWRAGIGETYKKDH